MKILTAAQTHDLDRATEREQHLTSLALMERAAQALLGWFEGRFGASKPADTLVLCGPGNNGGDGLALARLLHEAGYPVRVALLPADKYAPDYEHNLHLLPKVLSVRKLASGSLPILDAETLVVDALFGTGTSRPLTGLAAALVRHLNDSAVRVLSVDLPTGLLADAPQPSQKTASPNQETAADDPAAPVVQATYTVSFGLPKLAFLLPQNARYVGEWHVVDIGLSEHFIEQADTPWHLTQLPRPAAATPPGSLPPPAGPDEVTLPRRDKFAYKNTYGHALLLAGSRGKMGAAVLSAGACLRGGVGLLTVAVPGCGYDIMQLSHPEAMCLPDPEPAFVSELPALDAYQAVGIGPGLGQDEASRAVLEKLLRTTQVPLVIDADALNLLGTHRELLELLPPDTVLTPHVGEFARLTRKVSDDYERLALLRDFAQQHRCLIVLKGAYSAMAAPDGQVYFNCTGNPGMATGGSGDALTGLLLALRADQRFTPLAAVRLAVLAHGHAGDLALAGQGEAGLLAGDLVQHIGPALRDMTAR